MFVFGGAQTVASAADSSASASSPARVVAKDFFLRTALALGRDADGQGELPNGRYFERRAGGGNIAGSWDMRDALQEGVSYLVSGKVRVVNADGTPARARVLMRFGSDVALTTLQGQSAITLFDRPVAEETEFAGHVTFDGSKPLFGALALDVGSAVRVELSDLTIKTDTPPWALIPHRSRKIVLINDVPVGRNSVREGTIPIPPGARRAHVKVTYALPEILSTMAVRARATTTAARGFKVNQDVVSPERMFFWRDGDDRDHWITFEITNPSHTTGDRFRASVNGSGIAGWAAWDFEVVAGAVNERPAKEPYHRPPYRLALPATPTVNLDMTALEWDESSFKDGRPVWGTRPSHGYTQSGNNETGAYLPWPAQNAPGVDVHSMRVDAEGRPYVRLHTRKLDTPIKLANRELPHQAAMLHARHLDEWCHRRGIYSAQLLLPGRRGAWSAFWAVGRRGPKNSSIWPPEIDFMESFNGAYGADYTPDNTSSGQHAGMHGSNKREHIDGFDLNLTEAGFAPDFNFFTQIHHFTTVIEDEWITHFRDGVEFFRQRNIIDASDGNTDWSFYPIINVAVKDGSGGAYDEGSGDLRWYGLQYYAPDSEYKLVPHTEPTPYKNREVLPRPKL